jgi:hypothetical protein
MRTTAVATTHSRWGLTVGELMTGTSGHDCPCSPIEQTQNMQVALPAEPLKRRPCTHGTPQPIKQLPLPRQPPTVQHGTQSTWHHSGAGQSGEQPRVPRRHVVARSPSSPNPPRNCWPCGTYAIQHIPAANPPDYTHAAMQTQMFGHRVPPWGVQCRQQAAGLLQRPSLGQDAPAAGSTAAWLRYS